MLFSEAQNWDKWYGRKNSNLPIDEKAIRVEQGEYVVTTLENELGTFNVKQCVVVYVVNRVKQLHGLAHIDGHTEISSLDEFILSFKAKANELEIRILGARIQGGGLNNSELTLKRTQAFFSQSEIQRLLINKNIEQLINERNRNLQDFIIDGDGNVRQGLATGRATEHRALHAIQGVRRNGDYKGTYPIIKGYDYRDETIYLDERAIYKLQEYRVNPELDREERKAREFRDGESENHEEYDASIPKLLEYQNKAINTMLEAIGVRNQFLDQRLPGILARSCLYIGVGSQEKNQGIIDFIINSQDIGKLSKCLQVGVLAKNKATIIDAISIAAKYDKELNIGNLLEELTASYNKEYNADLTCKELSKKRYGAEISVEKFIATLATYSDTLKSSIILNDQSGHTNGRHSTAEEAVAAANCLGVGQLLETEIARKKLSIQVGFDKEKLIEDFKLQLSRMGMDRRKQLLLFAKVNACESFMQFESFVNGDALLGNGDQKQEIIEGVRLGLAKRDEDELQGKIQNIDAHYYVVQKNFLDIAMDRIPQFNSLTISIDIASFIKQPWSPPKIVAIAAMVVIVCKIYTKKTTIENSRY